VIFKIEFIAVIVARDAEAYQAVTTHVIYCSAIVAKAPNKVGGCIDSRPFMVAHVRIGRWGSKHGGDEKTSDDHQDDAGPTKAGAFCRLGLAAMWASFSARADFFAAFSARLQRHDLARNLPLAPRQARESYKAAAKQGQGWRKRNSVDIASADA
jgi:hypothetical protein